MKEMNSIFDEEHIDAEVVLYEVRLEKIERCGRPNVCIQVLPVDKTEGLIECVDNAHPFLEFKTVDGKQNSTSSDTLKEFIEQSPERKVNLFRTFLGFVVSGIALQLADRHGNSLTHRHPLFFHCLQMTTS